VRAVPHSHIGGFFTQQQSLHAQGYPSQLKAQQQLVQSTLILALDSALVALLLDQLQPIDALDHMR
jgi:hypothetical protein